MAARVELLILLAAAAACLPALAGPGCGSNGVGGLGSGGSGQGGLGGANGGMGGASGGGGAATAGSSSSGSSTTGAGGAMNGCTDAADTQILAANDVPTLAANCAKMNLTDDAAIEMCIEADTRGDGGPGLSAACTQCFDAAVDCAIDACPNQCLSDPSSPPCVTCQAESCDPAFYACSGLPQAAPDAGADGG